MADWTTNSNEALALRLGTQINDILVLSHTTVEVRAKADQDDSDGKSATFHPTFTYPVGPL